jgi:sugar O-acyltransferase (sialic acid O-acetyltransferase NeuD family)
MLQSQVSTPSSGSSPTQWIVLRSESWHGILGLILAEFLMKQVTDIIILGSVGNCIDILDTILEVNECPTPARFNGPFRCLGFLDDDPHKSGTSIHGFPVIGTLQDAPEFSNCLFVNGIGSSRSFRIKEKIIRSTGIPDSAFATVIHPTASVSRFASIGPGSVILQHVTIAANAHVGQHVIVLPHSIISHDAVVGDFSCIAAGVCISGNVSIGKNCYLGTNASVRDGISIGESSLVGMGSNVIHNLPGHVTAMGNPARISS